ncbi:PTR2-domain-containing protein [Lojkania enalia]|uniref:PTR2-domain-containing protein n=1 Tax=Lojkania enalia TaxID=147567 RepID=A0A9P4N245_9PLEO|nr:PTR2-domain-containing protein [Didymosphaeria enalia]
MCFEKNNSSVTTSTGAPVKAFSISENTQPSEVQLATLRHVPDKIPWAAWLVVAFSSAERFSYFGFTGPLQNYIQNPINDPVRPGALGLGQSKATALNCFLNVLTYTTTIPAAIIADGYLGPFKLVCYSSLVYLAGLLLLFSTSLPVSLHAGAGFGGLIGALTLIGLGVGGIKSSVSPFLADQLASTVTHVKKLECGEEVIVDRDITVRRVYSIYYWGVNIGGLSGIATTSLEKNYGFWTAFLLPLCSLSLALAFFIVGRRIYTHHIPQRGMLKNLFKALGIAIRNKFNLDAAKASFQESKHGRSVAWDDTFVIELRRALRDCRVWIIYPIVWLCFSQNQTNLVSQAADMETHSLPNDMLSNLNPISVIIILPLLDKFVYPFMKRVKLPSTSTVRMTIGFLFISISMAIAASVQQVVYMSPPCYKSPQHCAEVLEHPRPNEISVALQVPIYVVGAVGEVFFSVAGSEYAYNQAPANMKSILQAVYMFTLAISSTLGLAVSPAFRDPYMTIVYSTLAGVMMVCTIIFGFFFWRTK